MNNPENLYRLLSTPDANTEENLFYTDEPIGEQEDLFFQKDEEDINSRLEKAKKSKLGALSRLNSGASLDDSFTDMGDGWLESNKNKIWNDLSDQGIQSLTNYVMDNKVLTSDENGNVFDKNGEQFTGRTRRIYFGGSKDSSDEVVKLGLARGDKPSSAARYTPDGNGYGWESGKFGIDVNRLESDVLVPYDVAVMYEAVSHGRKKALEGRVVKDMFADPFGKDLYGSGASEYYKNREALFGAPTEINEELGARLFDEYIAKVPDNQKGNRQYKGELGLLLGNYGDVGPGDSDYDRIAKESARIAEERGITLGSIADNAVEFAGRIANTGSGFISTFVKELIINPADALGDATGLYDLGTEEEKNNYTDNFFGYDPTKAADAMEKVGGYFDKANDSNLSTADRMKAVGNGLLEVFLTPEMIGTSLGAMLSWITPGAILKGLGVGSKIATSYKEVDKLVNSGKISTMAGRAEKAKKFLSVEGAKGFLSNQAGYISSSLGNINNQYDEFVRNNNGVGLTGTDKAEWLAGRFAVQMVNQNLDRFVDLKVLQAPGTVKALTTAVKAMSTKEFSGLAGTLGRGLIVTAASSGSEAVQEYAQTSMELWNSRFGSEQFKDLDTFMKFMSDPDNIREAGIAAIAGAGGSGQFEVAGGIAPFTGSVVDATKGIIPSFPKGKGPIPAAISGETPATPEEVKTAKGRYLGLLKKVTKGAAKVDASTIGILLDDIDELNSTKHVIGDQGAETQAKFEKFYEDTVVHLETFISENKDLKLDKNITRKTVKQSKKDLDSSEDKKHIDTTPDSKKEAFINLAKVLVGDGKNRGYKTSLTAVVKAFNKADKDSIVSDTGITDKQLKSLELALTDKTSKDIQGTYSVLAEALYESDIATFSDTESKPKAKVSNKSKFKDVNENTSSDKQIQEATAEVTNLESTLSNEETITAIAESQGVTAEEVINDTVVKLTAAKGKLESLSKESTAETSTDNGTVLGSSSSSQSTNTVQSEVDVEQEFEDGTYNDYSGGVTAERILDVVLGSSRSKGHSAEFKDNMKSFAAANGVNINNIYKTYSGVKTHASVEDEAVRGQRGVLPRLARLSGLVESSNYNEKAFKKELAGISGMQAALVNSTRNLKNGMSKAVVKAKELNKGKLIPGKDGDFKKVKTEYIKADGANHVIYVRKENGKWKADLKFEKGLVKDKEGYTKAIDDGLSKIAIRDVENKTGLAHNIGNYTVPSKAGKRNKIQQSDATYVDNLVSFIKRVNPNSKGVTKVILGTDTTAKWKGKSDYLKNNLSVINKTDIDENDVVLINSTTIKENPKGKGLPYEASLGDAASASLRAAVAAGATIILDKDLFTAEDKRVAGAIVGRITLGTDYAVVDGKDRTLLIKRTPAAREALVSAIEEDGKAEIVKEGKLADKAELVRLKRIIDTKVDPVTGKELVGDSALAVHSPYKALFDKVLKDDFDDNKDNLNKYLERVSAEEVKEAATKIINTKKDEATVDTDTFTDKAFESQVKESVAAQKEKNEAASKILESLREGIAKDPSRSERESMFAKVLNSVGAKAKGLIESILGEKSFAKGKNDMYEEVYRDRKSGLEFIVPRRSITDEQVEALFAKNNEFSGHPLKANGSKISTAHDFVGVRRVVQDATKLVSVSRTTVVNSIPAEYLPFNVREAIKTFTEAAEKRLKEVGTAEKDEQTDIRTKGKFGTGSLNLHNSLSRGIIFDKEGNANPEVMTAMYLAIGELVSKDKSSMGRGFKKDDDIARMFGVSGSEVTTKMRKIAYENGSLLKSVAGAVGKSMATQLGLIKVKDDNTSAEEYEALISDLGNAAVLVAEEAGLLGSNTVESNELADLYDGEKIEGNKAKTYFIHLADNRTKKDGNYVYTPTEDVETFTELFKEVIEEFPEALTERKEVSFSFPDEEKLENAINNVRNDIYGKQVPKRAKGTLKTLMKTPYTHSVDRVDDFLAMVDDPDNNIMKNLGWVKLSTEEELSPEYEALYYRDKEVQASINRDIEDSINELRLLSERVRNEDKGEADAIYFDYFYSGNDRYMLNSNSINPQTDKIHRFLIVPMDHIIEYKVAVNDDGGVLFNTNKDESTDQSFLVRMALAQAFGKSVDKIASLDIIEFGNAMLSMSEADLEVAKKGLVRDGKFVVKSDGKEYEGEAEHVTHALQAIDFLQKTQEALSEKGNGLITSSLSFESDSLTNGFMNKLLQMPILEGDMDESFARVGILTSKYLEDLKTKETFRNPDNLEIDFNPKEGHAMNDLIATESFSDSYENLGVSVVDALRKGGPQNENLTASKDSEIKKSGKGIFDALLPILPGGDSIDTGKAGDKIDSTLRALFKNPFMIFNYSAGIGRIVKNLGFDVAQEVGRTLATADLTDEKHAGTLAVAEDLIKATGLQYKNDNKKIVVIKTAKQLQEVLRTRNLSQIRLANKFRLDTDPKDSNAVMATNLEDAISGVVGLTYGKEVQRVFEEKFEKFIEVQDAMNDTFKVSFRIFDKKRMDMLTAIAKASPNRILTSKDHDDVLEALWQDFPWIVGPLTESADEKDVIGVVGSTSRSTRGVESSRKSPQTMLKGKGSKTRTVTPLAKYLEEAMSSGSVLPFHALDGSEISALMDAMDMFSIAAIHDAIIAPLDASDKASLKYQEAIASNNTNYSLAESLGKLATRIELSIEKEGFNKDYKEVGVDGLKIASDKKNKMTFPMAARASVSKLKDVVANIEAKREQFFGPKDNMGNHNGEGDLKGALVGNMASGPGGMSVFGVESEVDDSYKEKFSPMYKQYYDVSIEDTAESTEPKDTGKIKDITEDAALAKYIVSKIKEERAANTEEAKSTVFNEQEQTIMKEALEEKLKSTKSDSVKKEIASSLSKLSKINNDENSDSDILKTFSYSGTSEDSVVTDTKSLESINDLTKDC